MEAIHYINEEAVEREEKGMNTTAKMNPLAISTYIDSRYNAMLHDVKVEHALGRL
jgi:hypothetical protein